MAGNSIASGAVVITASADQLANGLNQAGKRIDDFGKKANTKLTQSGREGGHNFARSLGHDFAQEIGRRSFIGGVLGGLAGGGLVGGVSELVANSVALAAEPLANFVSGMDEAKYAAQLTAKQLSYIEESIGRTVKLSTEWRNAMVQPADIAKSLGDDMSLIEDTVKTMTEDWKNMANAAKEAREFTAASLGRFIIRKDEEFQQETTKRANDQSTAIKKLVDQWKELQLQKERALDPRKDPVKIGLINKELARMSDELLKLGRDDIEIKLIDLEKLGANQQELDTALQTLTKIRDVKAKMAADEAATGRTGAGAAGLFGGLRAGLQMMAGGAAELGKQIERRLAGADDLDGKAKLAAAIESGTAEGYSLSIRNRFGTPDMMTEDVNKANGAKLDAIKAVIKDGLDSIRDALKGVGIL